MKPTLADIDIEAKPERSPIEWDSYRDRLKHVETIRRNGRVYQVIGLVIESEGPSGSIGELCHVYTTSRAEPIPAQIVGFREKKVLLMPLGPMTGIHPGSHVVASGHPPTIGVGESLLGRVLDGLGRPIDDVGPVHPDARVSVQNPPPNPLQRRRIREPIGSGIRAIDGLLTVGKGQRVGIFSGSGVGKSCLLGMIARYTSADVRVIALIGERGREVREFIERDLGEEALRQSVVVVATSDMPPLVRIQGALNAITIAEYFRDRGRDVLLLMDSITRFATAQREVGLAIGEPPATRGFTPSVFEMLPRFLERSGTRAGAGSITGLFTVLVEGDDMNDPVADSARSILDGHIVLSRDLAAQGHYPAIDVLGSISRVMNDIAGDEHRDAALLIRDLLAAYQESKDLIEIGAYSAGSNPRVDLAIKFREGILRFLRQPIHESSEYTSNVQNLLDLSAEIQAAKAGGRK
jgi:flagellum-specific ATP synthase